MGNEEIKVQDALGLLKSFTVYIMTPGASHSRLAIGVYTSSFSGAYEQGKERAKEQKSYDNRTCYVCAICEDITGKWAVYDKDKRKGRSWLP